MSKHTARHFWNKVIKDVNEKGCWNRKGSKNEKGYVRFLFNGRRMMAHRVSYILTYGEFDDALQVLHRCDNPSCVNPEHLFLGTHQDNMDDKVQKGRSWSKITKEQVIEIREMYATGKFLQREIAEKYGIKHVQVSRIVSGDRWGHV